MVTPGVDLALHLRRTATCLIRWDSQVPELCSIKRARRVGWGLRHPVTDRRQFYRVSSSYLQSEEDPVATGQWIGSKPCRLTSTQLCRHISVSSGFTAASNAR